MSIWISMTMIFDAECFAACSLVFMQIRSVHDAIEETIIKSHSFAENVTEDEEN